MVSLADFNKPQAEGDNPLSDFAKGSEGAVRGGVNPATVSNLAAHTAVLAPPDKLMPTYTAVSNELTANGTSSTMDTTLADHQVATDASTLDVMNKSMGDPSVSLDDKVALMTAYTSNGLPNSDSSLGAKVTRQGAISPSSPTDNDETNVTRIDITKTMDEVDAYNGWVSQQANMLRSATQDNLGGKLNTITNALEMIVPFMQGSAQAKISSALATSGTDKGVQIAKSLAFLGESKEGLRVAVAAMPMDKRMEFAKQLLQIVQESGGSITNRPNDMNMVNELQDALTPGNYSGTSRVIDDISSVLDMTLVGGPLWKTAKGFVRGMAGIGSAAGKVAAGARADAAIERMGKVVDGSIITAEKPAAKSGEVANQADFEHAYGGMPNVQDVKPVAQPDGIPDFPLPAPAAKPVAISEETAATTRQIITDNIHRELNDMGAPPSVIADVKKAIGKQITPISLADPKLGERLNSQISTVFKRNALEPIDPEALTRIRQYTEARSGVSRRVVRTDVDFGSVSQRIKDVNPGKARAMLAAVEADKTGDVAKALYGTTREEAIANDVLPEIGNIDGSVRGKVSIDEAAPNPDAAFIELQKRARGDSHMSQDEKTATRNLAKNDFRDVVGLTPRREMNTTTDVPTGVKFDQVFGPKDGGFANPEQAMTQAKFALKKYGVDERDIEVLKRDANGNFSPMDKSFSINDKTIEGEYLVRVKHEYEFSPADTVGLTMTSSNKFWRLFDSLPSMLSGKAGGVANHIIPSININDTLLTTAGSAVADKSAFYFKNLERLGKDYGNKFAGLDGYQRELVNKYIIKANNERLAFEPASLKAVGFSDEALDTIRSFKKAQDTNWHFENVDLNKTLHAKGWQKWVDQTGNSELIARPVRPGAVKFDEAVLGSDGKLVKISQADIKKLYDGGGTFAELRRPIEVDGDVAKHVLVKNNTESSYLRRIRSDDQTLSYIDGHYTVRYKDPYFLTKTVVGKNGEKFSKAVATAGTRSEADALLARLKTTDKTSEYNLRPDIKKHPDTYADFEWDQIVNSGRTSQRIRGARLADATGVQSDLNHVHIENPAESLIASFRSLSSRMAYRDYLELAKKRWMNQFGHTLKENEVGKFPDDIRTIGARTSIPTAMEIADAKTTWRFINQMDTGFVNLIDDASKAFFNHMSDVVGRQGWGHLEKGLRTVGEVGPTGFVRKKAFRLLLAGNPLGQIPVQALQALPTMIGTNPLAIPRIAAQVVLLNGMKLGLKAEDMNIFLDKASQLIVGLSQSEAAQLMEHYRLSSFEAAVDANVFVKDNLSKLADRGIGSQVGRVISAPLDITQKIGFEAGEQLLMQTMWLSEYDKLRRSGKAIDAESLELMGGKVRALTTNMNKAGEMPYNENVLSAALQFFQAPHKAFATVLIGHKGLTPMERIGLGTAYVATYGIGANWVTDQVDKMIPEGWAGKGLLKDGVFDMAFNKALSMIFNQPSEIAFADRLRLLQFPDVFKFFTGLMSQPWSQTVSGSPSMSLILGANPRVTNFIREFARPFTHPGDRTPEEMITIAKSFAEMFPGLSNAFKAQYMFEWHKAMGATGKTTDYHASDIDAVGKAFGFSTHDEIDKYAFQENLYRMSQQPMNDIRYLLSETAHHLAVEGISTSETKWYIDQLAEAQLHYKNDPYYMNLFQQQLMYQAAQGETTLFTSVMKMAGFHSKGEIQDLINNSPMSDAEKDTIMKAMTMIEDAK